MGWHHQLRNRPVLSLRDTYSAPLLEQCVGDCDGTTDEVRVFDLVPDAEALLGWPISRASAGATVRIGIGFPMQGRAARIPVTRSFLQTASSGSTQGEIGSAVLQGGVAGTPPPDSSCIDRIRVRMSKFARDRFWFDVFFNVEDRYVASNTLITGSGADGGPDGWSTVRQIALEHHVDEYAGGLSLGFWGRYVLSFQRVARSPEDRPRYPTVAGASRVERPHYFGSVNLTVTSSARWAQ